jgi:antitoxin component YwqK of YwqJK toxin-antitoxin module
MNKLFAVVFLFITTVAFAQSQTNQTDAQGRKQGAWIKKDVEGKLIYQGTFKDDKPIGEMKRYHPNGQLSAILLFSEGSNEADAQLFDEKGKLMARGKYDGQKKIGEWNYISDGKVVSTETYKDGLKHGLSKHFYKSGEILEESTWANGRMTGAYKSYFQDGKLFLECSYSEGKRNGSFKTWFPGGAIELEAAYSNDTKDKEWKYYDKTGKHLYTLKYDRGQLLNPEVQDSLDKLNTNQYKPRNTPDPEKFMQNPEEYMMLMQQQGK